MKKVKNLLIIACVFLVGYAGLSVKSVSYAVVPSDYDTWVLDNIVKAMPTEKGISWGILPGDYTVTIRIDPADSAHYVFLWEQNGSIIYIIEDRFINGSWVGPLIHQKPKEGQPYKKIWPKK